MGSELIVLYAVVAIFMILPFPRKCLARQRGSADGDEPAPIYEPQEDEPGRPLCKVRPHDQREGLQYNGSTVTLESGDFQILLPIKPGNYSYSGSYGPDDPCLY